MLSIIIPVYNQRHYTKSILAQIPLMTVGEYEIIVIDSASSDETPTEMGKYAQTDNWARYVTTAKDIRWWFNKWNVRYIRPEKNIFVNGAWNLWVKEARGEYICIMNNDLELTHGRDKPLIEWLVDNIQMTSPIYTIGEKPFNWRWYRNNPRNFYNICGHCFVMKKSDRVEIPDRFKIWYWDNRQYEQMARRKWIEMPILSSKIHHYESKTVKSKNKMIDMIIESDTREWNTWWKQHFISMDKWLI